MAVDDSKPVNGKDASSADTPPDVEAEVVSMGDRPARAHDEATTESDATLDLGGEPPFGDLHDETEQPVATDSTKWRASWLKPLGIGGAVAFLAVVAAASWFLTRSDEKGALEASPTTSSAKTVGDTAAPTGDEQPATELIIPSANEATTTPVSPIEKISNPDEMASVKEALQNLPPADDAGPGLPSLDSVDVEAIDNIGFLESAKDALNTLEEQTEQAEDTLPGNASQSEQEIATTADDTASQDEMTEQATIEPPGTTSNSAVESTITEEADTDPAPINSSDSSDAVNEASEETPDQRADAKTIIDREEINVASNAALITAEESARAANEEIASLQNALQAANRQIAALEADLAQARLSFNAETMARENAASDEIADLRARLANAEARAARLPSEGAMISMMNALATGSPFAGPLRSAGTIIQAETAPIAAYAASGVPTYAEIERAFEPAARKAVAAEIRAKANGPVARFFASVASLIVVRPAEPQAGNTLGARLSRAEAALENNDIGVALQEVSPIDGKAREAMEPWIRDAEARLAADRIAERLASADAAFRN